MISLWTEGRNAFEQLIVGHSLSCKTAELLEVYRSHRPEIELDDPTCMLLDTLVANGKVLGIITDGRSLTQRNKIEALGLYRWFQTENIIISEEFGSAKPAVRNFQYFMTKYPGKTYTYIGDNVDKDFISPKMLGWQTVCLKDNGQNIHLQDYNKNEDYLPDTIVTNIIEIKRLL